MIRIIFDNLQNVKNQLKKNSSVQFKLSNPSISTIRELFKLSAEHNIDPSITFTPENNSSKNNSLKNNHSKNNSPKTDEFWNAYKHICLGGTFDHLHPGHKLLLTEAAHLASEKITIGIAHDDLLKNKSLKQFIQSYSIREKSVKNYLQSVVSENDGNNLVIDIVPINDPVGPAGTVEDLDCIVISEETKAGGAYVNKIRLERGLGELAIHEIPLIQGESKIMEGEDDKISSSSIRLRKLGTLLKPVLKTNNQHSPYILGLTGGSCSGKSSVCQRFVKLGAKIIDCDKLGHQAYLPNTPCYKKMVAHFGKIIINEHDNSINRQELGKIVFSDKNELSKLESIVWPEIGKMVMAKVEECGSDDIVILDAALLIEAGWYGLCNEVWVCVLKRAEQVKRIVERDGGKGVDEEMAGKRLDNQIQDEDRFEFANVVLSTEWEEKFTQAQCEKAWGELRNRL